MIAEAREERTGTLTKKSTAANHGRRAHDALVASSVLAAVISHTQSTKRHILIVIVSKVREALLAARSVVHRLLLASSAGVALVLHLTIVLIRPILLLHLAHLVEHLVVALVGVRQAWSHHHLAKVNDLVQLRLAAAVSALALVHTARERLVEEALRQVGGRLLSLARLAEVTVRIVVAAVVVLIEADSLPVVHAWLV